jgi:hypothetical protein
MTVKQYHDEIRVPALNDLLGGTPTLQEMRTWR